MFDPFRRAGLWRWRRGGLAACALLVVLAGCVSAPPPLAVSSRTGVVVAPPRSQPQEQSQCGFASWYAMTSRTASGERANPEAMTAAHRSLPFGTRVEVTNLANGRSAVVRVNDRGPFISGRIIDVTKAAASKLGFVSQGTARVRIRADGVGDGLLGPRGLGGLGGLGPLGGLGSFGAASCS